jgi:hypothetical protein
LGLLRSVFQNALSGLFKPTSARSFLRVDRAFIRISEPAGIVCCALKGPQAAICSNGRCIRACQVETPEGIHAKIDSPAIASRKGYPIALRLTSAQTAVVLLGLLDR